MQGSPQDRENVGIKIVHSLRVFENATRITQALDLEETLTELAHVAALLHDVGRFPQYAHYGTFNDSMSANHACLSVDVLRETDVLSRLSRVHRRQVLGAIFLHNRKSFSSRLPPAMNTITRIVRDADKLDIISVLLAHFAPGAAHNGVVTLHLKPHPTAYSRHIFQSVRHGTMVNYQDMVWINDFKLLLCSWVHDFNFGVSRKMVRERRYVDGLFDLLPMSAEFNALRDQLLGVLEEKG